MADSLRDRIAAVLKLKYLGSDDLHQHAADAVIAALGLAEERCHGNSLNQPTHLNVGVLPHGWVHRYVTEWIADP